MPDTAGRNETVSGRAPASIMALAPAGGLFKLAEPIVAALTRRTVETDLQTLKALLEAKVPAGA